MSIEREVEQLTNAVQNLVDQIHEMTVTNQKVLMVLLDLVAGDDDVTQPQTDMDGNPV